MGDNGNIDQVNSEGSPEIYDDSFSLVNGLCVIQSCTLNAQDGSLATFSMTLEGSGDFEV